MPVRSQPESAKTPGCSALYMDNSTWASSTWASCSGVMASGSLMPSAAMMKLTVVQAMPLVVKTAL